MKPFPALTMRLMAPELSGCEAMEGFGKYAMQLGESIENKASDSGDESND